MGVERRVLGFDWSPATGFLMGISGLAGAAATLILGLVTQRNKDRQTLTADQNEMIRTLWEQTQTQAALIEQMQSAHQETLEARAKAHRRDMDALRLLYEQRIEELQRQLEDATRSRDAGAGNDD